jgi:hypothetical protein
MGNPQLYYRLRRQDRPVGYVLDVPVLYTQISFLFYFMTSFVPRFYHFEF